MESGSYIAILDVGKTNTRLIVAGQETGNIVWMAERASNTLNSSPVRQLDVAGIERWLVERLSDIPHRDRITAIVPIAHGAAAVLVDSTRQVLLAPDYEDARFELVAQTYQKERDSYATTYSPSLPLGLNLGRQLYFLHQHASDLLSRCQHILLYPQFWAWRLSGVMASEITSLGCHTDLWQVSGMRFSSLANRHGWTAKFPPLHRATDTLGVVSEEIARRTGLNPDCRVLCGLHDSNASYLCHLNQRLDEKPFAVISSGTWTVIMARGSDLRRLHPEHDMLANIDAFGEPVGTARFMGGREYLAIAGGIGVQQTPTVETLREIIARRVMALPSFAAGGPFSTKAGRLIGVDGLSGVGRATLATLYVALMSDLVLDLLGATGNIVIDGPLATNDVYCSLLAALRSQSSVHRSTQRAGSVMAARALMGYRSDIPQAPAVQPLYVPELKSYQARWQNLVC